MSTANTARTVRNSGRLVVDPTDLSAAFPHGGTEIGRTKGVALESQGEPYRIQGEGIGQATDILEPDKRWTFGAMLRGFNDASVAQLLNDGASAGSVSRHQVYDVPGTTTPGASALTRAVILLHVPDDPLNVPALLIYAAVPVIVPGSEIAFQRSEEMLVPIGFECMQDETANKILSIGRLSDLSLT